MKAFKNEQWLDFATYKNTEWNKKVAANGCFSNNITKRMEEVLHNYLDSWGNKFTRVTRGIAFLL